MIAAASLSQPDFFSKTGTIPEAQEAAISAVIEGWDLQAIAKPWEDQIKPDLKDRDQFENVIEVCNGRVKDITQACDNHVRDLHKKLDDRVNALFESFIKIDDHFNQHRNINGVQDERAIVMGHISAAEIDSENIVIALKARFKAIQKEWDIPMENLKQNRFKRQAQLDQEEALGEAYVICQESIRQVEEIQQRVRSAYATIHVMDAEDTLCEKPQARIEEIEFMETDLLPLLDKNTRKAFFDKNKEATPFFIFLTIYWYAFENSKKTELPSFLPYHLRREIERLQSMISSEDLSVLSIQEEKFFADFKEFGSWRSSLKDNAPLEELLKISDKMLENKGFTTTFFDCWHACVDFPDDDRYRSYEDYQAYKESIKWWFSDRE